MEIDKQLEIIIKDGDKYGVPPIVIEKAIAPVIKTFASNLKLEEYYILQNLAEDWILRVIQNPQLQQEKTVIHAFATVKDAATFQGNTDPNIYAAPIPIANLLFRLFSLQQVDSVIFLDTPGNLERGIEIKRDRFSALIQEQIQQLNSPPPNIA